MEKVIIGVARTERGYSADCSLLPGWVVAVSGDFSDLEREVKESIDFYVDCAKEDSDSYPPVFDGEYELVYKFDVQSLLAFYSNIFSFAALEHLTGINQKQLAHYAAGRSIPRAPQVKRIADGLHKLANDLQRISV
jgi:hypothetical protein